MKKMINKTTITATVLCLLPIALAAVLYGQLPARIAVHFNDAGSPNQYLPKAMAAFGLPILLAVINLYVHFRIYNDPKVENSAASLRFLSKWIVPAVSFIMVPVTLFLAMGKNIPISMIGGAMAGLVIIISGNYLPKCRRNYTMGIRLPWTLDNEDTWYHTHRFTGFIWVIGGSMIAANAFLRIPYLTIILIFCIVVLPFGDSYLYYQKVSKK